MRKPPCECHVLADIYKRARIAEDRAICSITGVVGPELIQRRDDAWAQYEAARLNCPFSTIYPHY